MSIDESGRADVWWRAHYVRCGARLRQYVTEVLDECYLWQWRCDQCGGHSPAFLDDIEDDDLAPEVGYQD